MSPRVLFDPLGEEIDCGEDETVLEAAFRSGYALVHGCREGQCSACKAFVLEGDVSLRRHSSFALSEAEDEQGYTLLCRAMPDSDLVIELLHFDPDAIRLEHPPREGTARVTALQALTHDMRRLELEVLSPDDFAFRPGQYVDVEIPGSSGARRSFSMANLPGDGRIELIIKRYPGGRFSGLLDGDGLQLGDELPFAGPYGAFHLRQSGRAVVLVAGGSGLAPILAVLRELAAEPSQRPVRLFYGVRERRDLFWLERVRELGARLPDFRFVPVLSQQEWEGDTGFVHEVAGRLLAEEPALGELEGYMCGPPPMIDAAAEMLADRHGVPEERIHHDKFTVAADAAADQEVST